MQKHRSSNRTKIKIAKWFFALAVLLFVGKPFIGFAMSESAPVNEFSILVKSFTKRKHEYVENSQYDIKTVQKKLADPVNMLTLLFSALLAFLLPRIADELSVRNDQLLYRRKVSLAYAPSPWLSNRQLLI